MSNNMLTKPSPRVLFFGMEGTFSLPSLLALLESGIEVCAVVVPASPIPGRALPSIQRREPPYTTRSTLPMLNSSPYSSIVHIAWKQRIPVWEVQRLSHPATIATLASYQPDIICVSCFSLLIPPAILNLPRLGCLNVHPSLLPANRGPVPLFWTFREGSSSTGVTIHLMDAGMDRGDILAQDTIEVPDGISYSQLEGQCAALGGSLLARTAWNLYKGQATCTPQDEAKSSYHSFPTNDDFVVPVGKWSARHVYNFIQGVGHWDRPVELRLKDESFLCRTAISYSLEDTNDNSSEKYQRAIEELVIRCRNGWVRVFAIRE